MMPGSLMETHKFNTIHYLIDRQEELFEFTRLLIATPSVNPPGDERAMVKTVIRRLNDLGLDGAVKNWGRSKLLNLFAKYSMTQCHRE